MSKQLTAEEILSSPILAKHFSLDEAEKALSQALSQLHQALKERMPEKKEYPESTEEPTLAEALKTGEVSGFNNALDLVDKIFNDFFKWGK